MCLSKFPKTYNIEIMKDEVLKRNEIIDKILESRCNFILIHPSALWFFLDEIFKLLRKRIPSFLVRKRNKKKRKQESFLKNISKFLVWDNETIEGCGSFKISESLQYWNHERQSAEKKRNYWQNFGIIMQFHFNPSFCTLILFRWDF